MRYKEVNTRFLSEVVAITIESSKMKRQLVLLLITVCVTFAHECENSCNSKCSTHRCRISCYRDCECRSCCASSSCQQQSCCNSCPQSSCCSSNCDTKEKEIEDRTVVIEGGSAPPSNSNVSITLNNVINTVNRIHNPINVTTINENNIELIPSHDSSTCCTVLVPKNCTDGSDTCGVEKKTVCSEEVCRKKDVEVIEPNVMPYVPPPVYPQPECIPQPYVVPQPIPMPMPQPCAVPYSPCQFGAIAPQPSYPCSFG